MTLGLLHTLDPVILTFAVTIAALSGIVKGCVGFGMPLILISGLSTFLDPKIAIAGTIAPIVVSNFQQTFRTGMGPALEGVRQFWRYVLIVCCAIFLAAQFVPSIPSKALYFILGVPVMALSLIQLLGVRLFIPTAHRGWAEWGVGLVSGTLGGLTGSWGPTTVLYLLAIETQKMRQVVVQGIVFGVGSVTILLAHLRSGILNDETIPFTLALLPPAMFGIWIGLQIQDKLDQERFRKMTLIVLLVTAANLMRKGFLP